MTDRKLLEDAAKAAGIEKDDSPYNGGGAGNDGFDLMGNMVLDWRNNIRWNPLTDDGDALRLAVKCNLDIELQEDCIYASGVDVQNFQLFEWHKDDKCSATRRAIVRAAAAIGEKL